MNVFSQWIQQPHSLILRRWLFQVHLWTGIATGVYIVLISLSGSVLVYRNELYREFAPRPVVVEASGARLSDDALSDAARDAYPDADVTGLQRGKAENHAVEITLRTEDGQVRRLFDPFTGQDLGNPIPIGFRLTAWLLEFHRNLLGAESGRRVNGIGGLLVMLLCMTGAIIWWPGNRTWRRSLTIDVKSKTRPLAWTLHSALGFWFFAFILMWGITGAFLTFQETFAAFFDYLQPPADENPVERTVDRVQYWLAYLHFGRLGGRGIPGCGAGLCDSITKATWAGAGLIPAVMFVTGALMWWNRVLRPARRRRRKLDRVA